MTSITGTAPRRRALLGVFIAVAMTAAACGGNDAPASTAPAPAAPSGGASSGGSTPAEPCQIKTYRFGYEGPPATNQRIAADIFQEALLEVSGGCILLQTYGSGQLGGEPALLEQLQAGTLEFVNSSTANAAILNPASGVFSLHYLFDGPEHQTRALQDPGVLDFYRNMMDNDRVKVLTLYTLPLRHMYSKDTYVRSPADLAGKTVRVQATQTEARFFGAYGAQTVNMAFGEIYSSMQTGVIDFAENAITYYGASKHFEVAPIMSATQHAGNTQVIWASRANWDRMTEQEREWFTEAAAIVNEKAVPSAFELERVRRDEYSQQGMIFFEDVDREAFKALAKPVFDEILPTLGPDAVRIVELIRALR
jgi:TRAP-type transport system periplasmic protein